MTMSNIDKLIRKLLIRTKNGKIVSGFEIRFWIDISFLYWKPIVELHGDMPHVFWLFFRGNFQILYLRSTHKWNNNLTSDSEIKG